MSWLERMRQKSDAEKRVFSFNLAILITIIVAGLWLINVLHLVNDIDGNLKQTASPLDSVVSGVKSLLDVESTDVYRAK